MPKDLRTYLLLSGFIHLVLCFFLWYTPAFQIEPPKTYKVTWIQLSKGDGGKNLKASYKKSKTLPQSTVREQKYAKKDQAKDKRGQDLRSKKSQTKQTVMQKYSQKRTSDKGGINLKKKTKTKSKSGSKRINNALARIDNQLKQRRVNLALAQTKDKETGQSLYGGSKGTNTRQVLIQYYNAVKRKINRQWVASNRNFTDQLVTKIAVKIDIKGNILRSSFRKTSGNGSFDSLAMRAIRRAAPFPSPPPSLRREALSEGFLIEFNPNRAR